MSDDKRLAGSGIDLERVLKKMEGVYFEPVDAGSIRLLDLLTRQPLNPNQPPPSVLQSAQQRDGFGYLKFLGRMCTLKGGALALVLCNHFSGNDVLDLRAQHGKVLAAKTIAIETGWKQVRGEGFPRLNQVELVLSPNPSQAAFQQKLHAWLAANNKRVLPCNFSDPSDDLLIQMQHTGQLLQAISANDGGVLDTRTRNRALTILDCVLQLHRQWFILGQYGWWHQTEGLVRPQPLILGPWQLPNAARLRSYAGVPVEVHETQHANNPLDHRYGEVFMSAMTTCELTTAQLDVPQP